MVSDQEKIRKICDKLKVVYVENEKGLAYND